MPKNLQATSNKVEEAMKELCTDPTSGTGSQSSKNEVMSYVMFRM